jgi:hypothetical protein
MGTLGARGDSLGNPGVFKDGWSTPTGGCAGQADGTRRAALERTHRVRPMQWNGMQCRAVMIIRMAAATSTAATAIINHNHHEA